MNGTLQHQVMPQKLNPLLRFAKGVHTIPLNLIHINLTKNTIHLKIDNPNTNKEILVYNVLGSRVAEYHNINLNTFTINNLIATKSGLFLKIVLDNDGTVMKIIVY